ncbi:hypothetical protein SLOPH_1060 [Spraguea lophii 42_110]|uniref:Uncharacterized protein n=1 Tax=Spraguea lophii (strain 42_110) TaxID=1358809 RepID=S7W747_SPRLO|nr:hypothetical protein SLOPH_1060 [Spraguea lophii 42_110]
MAFIIFYPVKFRFIDFYNDFFLNHLIFLVCFNTTFSIILVILLIVFMFTLYNNLILFLPIKMLYINEITLSRFGFKLKKEFLVIKISGFSTFYRFFNIFHSAHLTEIMFTHYLIVFHSFYLIYIFLKYSTGIFLVSSQG